MSNLIQCKGQKVNNKNKILQILSQRNIKVTGDYTFLGYNAPYQMIARTNEIAIPIEWKEQ